MDSSGLASSLECDVLVVGGGATGAGVLFDLASRGLRVVLAEQNDIGTGTSGRYHGLLHSGGRYAVRDPESAKECIDENRILRKIAPHAVEDTGGYFVAMPPDAPEYEQPWLDGCAAVGIPTEHITPAQALKEEPHLNPAMRTVYRVPDASLDSFDLIHSLSEAAEALGGKTLSYHRITGIEVMGGKVSGATLAHRRTGETVRIHCGMIVNAAGPWAGVVAKLAGLHIAMAHDKGIMVAMNVRWVNTIVNRLDTPGDGDILVPVGTVCVIGTTSVHVDRPDDLSITPKEVTEMLDAGQVLVPEFRKARALRAWAGVRPLYEPPTRRNHGDQADHAEDGRFITRTFTTIDHSEEGVSGLLSIVGGKLTTYRLMAERISDQVCRTLGIHKPCTTADTVLPRPEWAHTGSRRMHTLTTRLHALEHADTQSGLICECEIVTRPQLEEAIQKAGPLVSLDDLRRDLRLGMGPCQAGFCGYRAAGILREKADLPRTKAADALRDFVEERFRGNRPLLWGHQLRQALLDETIYRRALGLASLPQTQPHQPESEPTA